MFSKMALAAALVGSSFAAPIAMQQPGRARRTGNTESTSSVGQLFAGTQHGDGTYYGTKDNGGNCRLDAAHTPGFVTLHGLPTVAINHGQYHGACGMCVEITSTDTAATSGTTPVAALNDGQPFIALVDDKCPGCANGDLDLALDGDGRWDISWKAVPCPVEKADGSLAAMDYFFEGTNAWYIKMQVRGHAVPLASVDMLIAGEWHSTSRTSDNFWILDSSAGFGSVSTNSEQHPLPVRLTSYDGVVVHDKVAMVSTANDVAVAGAGSQFGGASLDVATLTETPEPTEPASTTPEPTTEQIMLDDTGMCAATWAQCGGVSHSGATTCCSSAYTCLRYNDWYSQCVPL